MKVKDSAQGVNCGNLVVVSPDLLDSGLITNLLTHKLNLHSGSSHDTRK